MMEGIKMTNDNRKEKGSSKEISHNKHLPTWRASPLRSLLSTQIITICFNATILHLV